MKQIHHFVADYSFAIRSVKGHSVSQSVQTKRAKSSHVGFEDHEF